MSEVGDRPKVSAQRIGQATAARVGSELPSGPGTPLESLTGLRWCAAFGAFLAHVNVLLPIPGTRGVFAIGAAGVTFFFVLSGFVLTWTWQPGERAMLFYGRRFARIWPVLLLGVAIPLVFALTNPTLDADKVLLVLIALSALLAVQSWVPGWILISTNPVTWTVSCEALFYAIFPYSVRKLARLGIRQCLQIAVGLIALMLAQRILLWIAYPPEYHPSLDGKDWLVFGTYSPLARIPEFLLGMVVGLAFRKGWRTSLSVRSSFAALFAGIAVLWVFRNTAWRSAIPYDALIVVTAPLFALVIVALADRDLEGARSFLRGKVFVTLGNWSYAFYMFHFTLLFPIASMVFGGRDIVSFFTNPVEASWSNVLWALVALACGLLFAGLVYRFFEHPLERRLRRAWGLSRRRPERTG